MKVSMMPLSKMMLSVKNPYTVVRNLYSGLFV